jgi:hypothetical protein
MWLLTGGSEAEEVDDNSWEDDYYDNVAEIAKNLIACWPNPPVGVAKSIGTTLKKLQWFTSGQAPLDSSVRDALESIFSVHYDRSMSSYFATGPYVLMAQKPQALKGIYTSISDGGNAAPCEIIPRQGSADPSWRYVLINTYGKPPSIVMSQRGAKITEHLPDLLINYAGITTVAQGLYGDVVSTCAKACIEPTANAREMGRFAKRYKDCWDNCIWLPE